MHALCGAVVLVFAFALFSLHWIGGGDAKLAAATALWLGLTPLADYGLASAIAGGALTLAILMARRFALPQALASQAWIARLHDAKVRRTLRHCPSVRGTDRLSAETQFWSLLARLTSRVSTAPRLPRPPRRGVPRSPRFCFFAHY